MRTIFTFLYLCESLESLSLYSEGCFVMPAQEMVKRMV